MKKPFLHFPSRTAWIGLFNVRDDSWYFTDLTDTKYNLDMMSGFDRQSEFRCAALTLDSGKVVPMDCATQLPYICSVKLTAGQCIKIETRVYRHEPHSVRSGNFLCRLGL